MVTSIAHQSIDELGGAGSILQRQRRDHIKLDQLLDRLHDPGPSPDALLTEIARLVFPHAFAEEAVLWPLARRVLPDGEELTLRVEQEHQQINELWKRLERTPRTSSDHRVLVGQISTLLRTDVRDEEDELLPRLQQKLSPAELNSTGRRWEVVRRCAPTRPHPVVARRPPGNAVAALPLTVLDRARDRVDGVACARTGGAARLARQLGRRLDQVASRIERVPPLTKGEDPSTSRS